MFATIWSYVIKILIIDNERTRCALLSLSHYKPLGKAFTRSNQESYTRIHYSIKIWKYIRRTLLLTKGFKPQRQKPFCSITTVNITPLIIFNGSKLIKNIFYIIMPLLLVSLFCIKLPHKWPDTETRPLSLKCTQNGIYIYSRNCQKLENQCYKPINRIKITIYFQDIVVYYFIFIIIFPPSTFMEPYLHCFGSFSQKVYTSQYTNNISKRPKVFYGER